jgi:GNAT superfamily N-acetyltransferase
MKADIDIRLLTEEDVEAALALSASCGWNQRAAEWHMMLQIAPSGTFTAETPDGIVGTAIGIDYGSFGWIAMMLVNPAWRSRGLGARLLEAAMGAIPPDLPIRLDATPLGRPLYERYGFVLESSLTRFVRPPDAGPPPARGGGVRPLAESDLPAVMRMDDRITGAHRHGPLRWAFADAPRYAWIDAPGYCLGRGGRLFDHIGPIVADTAESAAAQTAAAIGESGGCSLVIDAHDAQQAFGAWLQKARFEPQRPLFRMCRPGRRLAPGRETPLTEFAIMGPEFS